MAEIIDTSLDLVLPDAVLAALRALEQNGHEAWCVGGCVRDALLGRAIHDFDVATAASWQQTEQVLGSHGFTVHRTGVEHGTVTASFDGVAIEVTTYRADGVYSDGRHPDEVTFVKSIDEDLARRDFTVNALAFHPDRGVKGVPGGLEDLRAGVIRAVGDPAARFSEDGLRILRACRFASQLGFRIDEETLDAMVSRKMMLGRVAIERIAHELDALLLGDYVHDALMQTINVLVAVMPELAACKGFDQHTPYHIYDVWEHTAWVVQRAPRTRLGRWAALLHDIGKPAACFFEGERAHFFGHAKLSALMGRSILQRLPFSDAFVQDVLTLVRLHDVQIAATPKSVRKALVRLDGNVALFRELIALKRADALAHSSLGEPRVQLAADLERVLEEVLAANEAFTVRQLAINGNDVLEMGIPSGPAVGEALEATLAAVIEDEVPNERQALLGFIAKLR